MSQAPGYIQRPHMRHNYRMGVSQEKARAVQYAMDKRREERGTTVIHVHEKPPKPRSSMPTDAEAGPAVLAHFAQHGQAPTVIRVPESWSWDGEYGVAVQGLPPDPVNDLSGRYGRAGRWVALRVIHDPDVFGWSVE